VTGVNWHTVARPIEPSLNSETHSIEPWHLIEANVLAQAIEIQGTPVLGLARALGLALQLLIA
jgi:hypothetical protein